MRVSKVGWAALVAAAGMAAGACGGGTSVEITQPEVGPPTKGEFVAQADKVCLGIADEAGRLAAEYQRILQSPEVQVADIEVVFHKLHEQLGVLERLVNGAPAADREVLVPAAEDARQAQAEFSRLFKPLSEREYDSLSPALQDSRWNTPGTPFERDAIVSALSHYGFEGCTSPEVLAAVRTASATVQPLTREQALAAFIRAEGAKEVSASRAADVAAARAAAAASASAAAAPPAPPADPAAPSGSGSGDSAGTSTTDTAAVNNLNTGVKAERLHYVENGAWTADPEELEAIEPGLTYAAGTKPAIEGTVYVHVVGAKAYLSAKGRTGKCYYVELMAEQLRGAVDPGCGDATSQTYAT